MNDAMTAPDLARFRLMCRQFQWLSIFMVVSVGGLLVLAHLAFPAQNWLVHGRIANTADTAASLIWMTPGVFYLFGVWSIGRALGQLAKGRLIQPTLASALRRVGLSVGLGAIFTVFVMTNLLRVVGASKGGYLNFDVAAMTLGMIGGALFLLGRVVDQAGRVQAELDEMV